MLERIHFLVVYVGSAAAVAYLAVCLTSAQVATFDCDRNEADTMSRCELAATLAAFAPEAGGVNFELLFAPDRPADDAATKAVAR